MLALCLVFLAGNIGFSQNLVLNGSFEKLDTCHTNPWLQVREAEDWQEFNTGAGGTPDIFSRCNGTAPLNPDPTQYQEAKEGGNYAAVGVYVSGNANFREYFFQQLSAPMKQGSRYCIRYFLSSMNMWYRTTGLSINFSTHAHEHINNNVLDVTSHVVPGSIITDTLDWTEVRFEFIADSAYNYITVGNFLYDSEMSIIQVQSTPANYSNAVYYIDDISIYEIKPLNAIDTMIYACSDSVLIGDMEEDFAAYSWFPITGLSDSTRFQVSALPEQTTTYTLTKTTNCDTSSIEITVIVDSAYCSYKGGFESFSLYPNPNNGIATMEFTLGHQDKNQLFIYNAIGQLIKIIDLQGGENQTAYLDLQDLSAGLYYYRLEVNGNVQVGEKFIVNK